MFLYSSIREMLFRLIHGRGHMWKEYNPKLKVENEKLK
jgi:hypothetical protein